MNEETQSLAGWVRRAGGIGWFIRRFGFAQLFMKPIRTAFAPFVIPLLRERHVMFRGEPISLVYARHNVTWANERCIELALARRFLEGVPSERILEVGNVTPAYFGGGHMVVDKYEPGCLQVDIVDFECDQRFDLILSISTFEHIAFDEKGGTENAEEVANKVRTALDRCLGLLKGGGGSLVITVPLGYNPALDAMIASGELGCDRATYFKRFPRRHWREVGKDQAHAPYGGRYPFANAIMLAEWDGR